MESRCGTFLPSSHRSLVAEHYERSPPPPPPKRSSEVEPQTNGV
ncbi:unnamed protein product [Arabidopsis halleri]